MFLKGYSCRQSSLLCELEQINMNTTFLTEFSTINNTNTNMSIINVANNKTIQLYYCTKSDAFSINESEDQLFNFGFTSKPLILLAFVMLIVQISLYCLKKRNHFSS